MKKSLTVSILLLIALPGFSQSDENFPASKNVMLELNFNPFGDDGVFSFDDFQTKYWVGRAVALRLGLQLDSKKNNTTEDDSPLSQGVEQTFTEKSFLWGFKPGIEFRIMPNSKVSPYWGFELSFIDKSSESEYVTFTESYDYETDGYVYEQTITKIDGAWRRMEFVEYDDPFGGIYQYATYTSERAFSSFGMNLLLGMDLFVLPNLYTGFELGLGYEGKKFKKITYNVENDTETIPPVKSSEFGFYYNNSIRLGVCF